MECVNIVSNFDKNFDFHSDNTTKEISSGDGIKTSSPLLRLASNVATYSLTSRYFSNLFTMSALMIIVYFHRARNIWPSSVGKNLFSFSWAFELLEGFTSQICGVVSSTILFWFGKGKSKILSG